MDQLQGIYSQTGFDLIGILSRVVNRPNPLVVVGNVDLSCSFTVSDPTRPDNPIVYASETFSRLTGYANSEIIGRNCRFLQSPTGMVAIGSVRKFSDSFVAYEMKQAILQARESQFSIINYRKSGDPFINLVTIVPLMSPVTNKVEYFVGFQVDLVEQPQAILNRCKEGSYIVDYKIADQLLSSANQIDHLPFPELEFHQPYEQPSLSSDTLYNLFVETSDFVHILSLRARFLYASPVALKKVLEYQSSAELVGRELHEFVHPADLVSVMRELRTSRVGDSINFVCRFRKKHSGYIYMEVNGHMFEGSGINRKCFILSGRERHVCLLPVVPGDPRDSDIWAKLSPEGVILFAVSGSAQFFGLEPDAIIGTKLADYVYPSDRRSLEESLQSLSQTRLYDQFPCRFRHSQRGVNAGDSGVSEASPGTPSTYSFISTAVQLYAEQSSSFSSNSSSATSSATLSTDTSSHVFCRIRLPHPQPRIGAPADFAVNVFDIMTETRATSLHYELNQLRIHNKRLREEIDSMCTTSKKNRRAGWRGAEIK
ncbi:hypothetical protein DFJ73DRAFT_860929 [Zopfochytrium polystomum]|nr:hypothetical protein DFJ73DRAFT_860929 [Zopfochytrium polystomum]